jgi:hypothetical protein
MKLSHIYRGIDICTVSKGTIIFFGKMLGMNKWLLRAFSFASNEDISVQQFLSALSEIISSSLCPLKHWQKQENYKDWLHTSD